MDLRLVVLKDKQCADHGFGEVAKKCTSSKYYKDKRKAVVACKALLNSVLQQNTLNKKECVFAPFLIVMGFEMQLSVVYLKSNGFYITQKIKTIAFPSSLDNFAEEATALAIGLLELVVSLKK